MIKRILSKLISCSKQYVLPHKIIHSMHGMVLLKTSDKLFHLHRAMTEEVKEYCQKENIEPDEIYFFSSYSTMVVKSVRNIKSDNKSKIHVIRTPDKTIVHVLMDTTIIKT